MSNARDIPQVAIIESQCFQGTHRDSSTALRSLKALKAGIGQRVPLQVKKPEQGHGIETGRNGSGEVVLGELDGIHIAIAADTTAQAGHTFPGANGRIRPPIIIHEPLSTVGCFKEL